MPDLHYVQAFISLSGGFEILPDLVSTALPPGLGEDGGTGPGVFAANSRMSTLAGGCCMLVDGIIVDRVTAGCVTDPS